VKTLAPIVLLCLAGVTPAPAGLAGVTPAAAAVSSSQLEGVKAEPSHDASLPLSLAFIDENGAPQTLRAAIGTTPAVVVFADYTCSNLCGPILSFAAAGLADTGLVPGRDFHLIAIGLNPEDGPDQARAMKASRVGVGPGLAAATMMLTGQPDAIAAATHAAGYQYVYDAEHDQFAHPAAAYVVTREGRIARLLSGLGLDGRDLRLALIDAGQGRVGSFIDQITLRCFGFDAARGISTAPISRLLAIGGAATVLAFIAGISLMELRLRRGRPS
jgi:protein SCO1/2